MPQRSGFRGKAFIRRATPLSAKQSVKRKKADGNEQDCILTVYSKILKAFVRKLQRFELNLKDTNMQKLVRA